MFYYDPPCILILKHPVNVNYNPIGQIWAADILANTIQRIHNRRDKTLLVLLRDMRAINLDSIKPNANRCQKIEQIEEEMQLSEGAPSTLDLHSRELETIHRHTITEPPP